MSSPLEQLQSDVLAKLSSEPLLENINGKSLRKMRVQSELDVALIYMQPKNIKRGCGYVVMMPTLDVEHPNTPGPLLAVTIGIRTYEEPNINLDPVTGTMQSAEEIAILNTKLLHQFRIEGLCSLYAGKDAVHPVDSPGGTICYESLLRGQLPEDIIPRVTIPTLTESSLTITLTAIESDVTIYYTIDGTPPGNLSANSTSVLYSAPFAVESGTVIRWAGYKDDYCSSDFGQATIT